MHFVLAIIGLIIAIGFGFYKEDAGLVFIGCFVGVIFVCAALAYEDYKKGILFKPKN